jgi:hypothetical protein
MQAIVEVASGYQGVMFKKVNFQQMCIAVFATDLFNT